MRTLTKTCLAVAAFALSAGAFAGTGYYVQAGGVTIPGGPTSSFGTPVAVLTTTVAPGSYLITARIDGASYAPNSGASCLFTVNGNQVGTQYYNLDTSSNWSNLSNKNMVALNRFSSEVEAQVSLICAHGYSFSNSAYFGGEMTLTPVDSIGQ